MSLTMREAIFAQQTDKTIIVLFTFDHPELEAPIRVCTNPTQRLSTDPLIYGTVSRGNEYVFVPMDAIYPDDVEGQAPRAKLSLDNVSVEGLMEGVFRVSDIIQLVPTPASVLIEVVLNTTPDIVEVSWDELQTVKATFTDLTVELELSMDSFATEPFPSGMFTPSSFATLF